MKLSGGRSVMINLKIKEWAKTNLIGKTIKCPHLGVDITFTMSGVKEAINQPHKHLYYKNESIKDIMNVLPSSTFVGTIAHSSGNPNLVYHYFKTIIEGEHSYIVLRETKHNNVVIFYSIVDYIKK